MIIKTLRSVIGLFLLLPCLLFAQGRNISGTVLEENGNPLIGATVVESGTTNGTITDVNGAFSLRVNGNAIEISHIGYQTIVQALDGRTSYSISLAENVELIDQIVVVGSRRPGRIKTETPVPIDVLNVGLTQFPSGKMDITSMLNYAAPSFNYSKQSGSDGADHLDLASLRGLSTDHTLVLINGKRRHQTPFIGVFGTRGRGSSGTDLNAIPQSSIDKIEILRDGASAQYGSDAIAGVMNIVLKKSVKKLSGQIAYSSYLDDKYNTILSKDAGYQEYDNKLDGQNISIGANYGFDVGRKGGFANVGIDFSRQGKTYRQGTIDKIPFNSVRTTHGDASLLGVGGMFNLELPIVNDRLGFYAFGGVNKKESDAFAYTRSYANNPERFPTDDAGNLIVVQDIIKITSDSSDYYFNPHIQTEVLDFAGTAGIKGMLHSKWNWDLSNTFGKSDFHFFGDKTFNAGLGANQTNFDDGGFSLAQNTVNLNVGKEFESVLSGMHLGIGAEFRSEKYNLYAGEVASYFNYNAAKATGAQGFPGYQPGDEVDDTRSCFGAYIDLETDITKRWLVDAAIRVENYSDFGFTHNYKLASRYRFSDGFNLRGSVSTGFRAPSLAQINFSSTFTTVEGGQIAEVKIAPNYSPITKAAGIPELKEEESTNMSLGFSYKAADGLTLTVDAYKVKVEDRIVLSGSFSASDESLDPALTNTLKDLKVESAQFFANAVNTTNNGIDIVLDYVFKPCAMSTMKLLATSNFQEVLLDKINVPVKLSTTPENQASFYSRREQLFIIASAPKAKMAFSLDYSRNKWSIGFRENYFGKVKLYGYADEDYSYDAKWVTDVFASYQIFNGGTIYLGADNLFNVHPDFALDGADQNTAYDNETGGPWDAVQMGGNGRRLFARLGIQF